MPASRARSRSPARLHGKHDAPLLRRARTGSGWTVSGLLAAAATVASCGAPVDDFDPQEQVATAEQEVHNVCPDGELVEGVDVSYYQDTINWQAVAGTNVVFAITRVSHGAPSLGGFADPEFDANWAGIQAQGMVRGVYQYWDPEDDPVPQANYLIEKVGMLGPGDLPAVVDVEETGGQSAATIISRLRTWMELVEAGTGRRPIIYTGSYFWDDNVGTSEFADEGYLVWTAHYTTAECPLTPNAWDRWAMHQYTSSGSVAGISGNVDRNHFNGGWEALNDLAANGYRAEIVSLDYPATMGAGEVASASLVVRNVGARAWGTATKLGTTEPRDRTSPFAADSWEGAGRVAALEADVPPGEEHTFTFELRAPVEQGDYVEHFNLLVEAVAWFSDTPPGGGPGDSEIALAIHVGEPGTGGDGGSSSGGSGPEGGEGPGSGGHDWLLASGVPGEEGGCECGLGGRRAPSGAWLAAVALGGALAGRRRWRRPHRQPRRAGGVRGFWG